MPELDILRDLLEHQLGTAWKLLDFHLTDLGDEECLWRPAGRGPHVFDDSGTWRATWPETEEYAAGPPSIAWLMWHIGFWWSMTLDHAFGEGTLRRESVVWPGEVASARRWLSSLHVEWRSALSTLPDEDLLSTARSRWPVADRPFYQLAGWVNVELMKNAAEIGYARFLYASARNP